MARVDDGGPSDGPLAGVRIGVTGARKGPELCAAIERRGGRALHGPTIEADQPAPDDELLPQLAELLATPPDWFVANTGIGVRLLADVADRHDRGSALRDVLAGATVVARGAKAVGGLRAIGADADEVSDAETDAAVAELLSDRVGAGDHLAVQYSGRTRNDYDDLCEQRGCTMTVLRPYRTGVPADPGPARRLVAAAVAGDLDVVVCTSAIATDHLFTIAERDDLAEDLRTVLRDGVAPRHRTGSLLTALEVWAAGR
jgi:uroporphyrinogen-III synthase